MKNKMLITGVSGLLGSNLAYYFRDKYDILGIYNSHLFLLDNIYTQKCDITAYDDIKRTIDAFSPNIIIHCASLTNVDACEADKEFAKLVNVLATKNIVEAVSDRDVKLIYISTDSVYDGGEGNFSEKDEINPQNYYGQTKYEGELEVSKQPDFFILRTNLFGWNIQDKYSLGEWVLKELKEHKRINGFKDVYFSTIYTLELARVIDISIQKNITGIYNCGSYNSCSKYEFALKVAGIFRLEKTLIAPISIEESCLTAKRGKNLSMDMTKLQKDIGYRIPDIDDSIKAFYRDYSCFFPERLQEQNTTYPLKNSFIQYGSQYIDNNDIQAVVKVLNSGRITQGLKIIEFEEGLAVYCQSRYAIAVNSGTSALHIACMAAGIKHGDEVITSPITFVASANCAVYCGAEPVFADIDPMTYNLSPVELGNKITKRTRAVIPVHFAGQSCDMESISYIVKAAEKKYGHKIYIIEDACHALGSFYKETVVGSCRYSDMAVMSFHPVKHITTGEGGAVLTNNKELDNKLRRLRSHGITSNPEEFFSKDLAFDSNNSRPNPWYYEQQDIGYNYRITDIQCALGLSQLEKLNTFRNRRRKIVCMYNKLFSNIKHIQTPFESNECDSNFHLYVLLIDFEKIGMHRGKFMHTLLARGIQTQVHYIPVHTHPFYQKNFTTQWSDYPSAEQYYKKCISIPLFPALTDSDVNKIFIEISAIIQNTSD
jgi:UDP-4-amino-4,6-dideoxy-N-acetyl-beta-L-altrosamine transaminase/dTDP-4-dehydrorhamnose reductase